LVFDIPGARGETSHQARFAALALGVLRALARLVATVLLALDLARVAREVARLLQDRAELRIDVEECARDPVTDGGGLRSYSAPSHVDGDVVTTLNLGDLEGLVDDHPRRLAPEVILERALVDDDLPVALHQADLCHRALSLPRRPVRLSLL